ncbi:MAG: DUF7666 domain-containing protein, partial [Nitrospiria bacterium]
MKNKKKTMKKEKSCLNCDINSQLGAKADHSKCSKKTQKKLWKSLPADLKPHDFQYKLGTWHKQEGKPDLCKNGLHASENVIDAMKFVNCEILAQVEVRGDHLEEKDKQCWSEMKIAKAWKWEKEDSVPLAIYAAELVIDIFEKEYLNDKRPREAIEAAKKWLKNPTSSAAYAAASASAAYDAAASVAHASSAASVADKIKEKCAQFVIA